MTQRNAGSKFSGLLAAVHERQENSDQESSGDQENSAVRKSAGPTEDGDGQGTSQNHAKTIPKQEDGLKQDAGPESVRRGRPRGKRSSEDFVQVTAYIGKDTHRAVKMALLSSGDGREFSELVEELLAGWLHSPK